jgi:hypothetical protein
MIKVKSNECPILEALELLHFKFITNIRSTGHLTLPHKSIYFQRL